MPPTPRVARDPYITRADSRVSPAEMLRRHQPPESTSGEGQTVVVQDSGLDVDHPWIRDSVADVEFHDFTGEGRGDAVGHGTATTDVATRYAEGATVVVHRVFGQQGSGGFEPFRKSFEWAREHADEVVGDGPPVPFNMSWGTNRQSREIDNYVNELANLGYIPVASSGNTGGSTGSPATARTAISVGALEEQGERMTNFSSWDTDSRAEPGTEGVPEVCAIGKDVVLARADGTSMGRVVDEKRVVASGTSFSAPFVTGVALDLVRRHGMRAVPLLRRLERTADDIPGTARDGLGRTNWQAAARPQESPAGEGTLRVADFPGVDTLALVDGDFLPEGAYDVTVHEESGSTWDVSATRRN